MGKGKSQLKIGIILNYLNLFIGTLIPIFYTPIMLNILGQEEYGLYKLSSSVTSYLSLISFGIGSAVTRYLIKARTQEGKEAEERMLGLFTSIFQVVAILSFVVGTVITMCLGAFYGQSLTDPELAKMKILVFLMVCNTALTFSVSPYVSVVNTHEKFIFLQCMNIVSTCVAPIVNLIMLFAGFASVGMAVSTLILSLVSNIIYLIYVRKSIGIKARFKNMPTNLLKEIFVFSFWIFVGNIVSQLYNATDTVLIGAIPALATVGVAKYNVGGVFNNIVFQAAVGISTLLTPKTNKMVFSGASNTELTDLAIKVGRIQGYIISLIITGFVVFGQPFIHFYAGKDYSESYWVALLMMIPNMIPLVQSVCLSIIISKNKHKFRSLVYLLIAIINVIGSWILMHYMGIIGAALVTGLALILGQGFIMNWYYSKKIGLEIKRFWKELLKVYIIPICMAGVFLLVSRFIDFYNIPRMLIGIVIYTLIYLILQWVIVCNKYEKELILNPIKKIISKFKRTDKNASN